MTNFDKFKNGLLESNFEEVKNNLSPNFVNKIINKKTWTPIIMASNNGAFDIAKLLIDNNCNIDYETTRNSSPSLWSMYVEMGSIDKFNHKNNYKQRAIHFACFNGHFDIVKLLIDNNCNIECRTDNSSTSMNTSLFFPLYKFDIDDSIWSYSVTPIHLACYNGHFDIVKLLIDNNCNIECKTINKYKPIHLACRNGGLEIVKLLVQNNCDLQSKTKYVRDCPSDIANQFDHSDCAKYINEIIELKKIFQSIRNNDEVEFNKYYNCDIFTIREDKIGLSVLEVAIDCKSDKIINYIINKSIDSSEQSYWMNDNIDGQINETIKLIQECLLYRCIRDHHQEAFDNLCTAEIINRNRKMVKLSFLEAAVQYGSCAFIDKILHRTMYNKQTWTNAKLIGQQNGNMKIVEVISIRERLLQSRQRANFSILHTSICDGDVDMMKYILDNDIVDRNLNNDIFGTALALAHSLCQDKCIEMLEQYNIDTNTCNKYLQSPLHEAIASGMNDHCGYLIDKLINIDRRGFNGLTALHCAVMFGYEDICQQLSKKGADSILYIDLSKISSLDQLKLIIKNPILQISNQENCLTLCIKLTNNIYPCFMEQLNQYSANSCDGDGNSLLHLSVKCLHVDLCRSLINATAIVDKVNIDGYTPLLELLRNVDNKIINENINRLITIVDILIESGADPNIKINNGKTSLQYGFELGNEKLMLSLTSKFQTFDNINEKDFQQVFINNWFQYGEILLDKMSKISLSSFISKEIISSSIPIANSNMLQKLFNNANNIVQQSTIEDLLNHSTCLEDEKMFRHLINIEIEESKLLDNGETLLTNLLKEKKISFCWFLLQSINSKHYINMINKNCESPLKITIEIGEMDLTEHLIKVCDKLNYEDKEGNTALMMLLKLISINIDDNNIDPRLLLLIKLMICYGGDIYKTTSRGQQIINICTVPFFRAQIELYYKTQNKLAKNTKEKVIEKIIHVDKIIEKICHVCMDREIDCVFHCGHTFCTFCSNLLFVCPVCRSQPTNPKRILFN